MFSAIPDHEEKRRIIEIMELYRSLPALWDVKNPEYSIRSVKDLQYEILLKKFRETNPNASRKDLTKKINSWRTNYRRELNRVRIENGRYKPVLFYYETLNFLSNIEEHHHHHSCTKSKMQEARPQPEPESKRKKRNPTDEQLNPLDSCQQMANVWAQKLSKMDRIQRIIAEKVINEVMFNAELGLLNYNTGLCNIEAVNIVSTTPTPMEREPKQEIITMEHNDIFGI